MLRESLKVKMDGRPCTQNVRKCGMNYDRSVGKCSEAKELAGIKDKNEVNTWYEYKI